MASSASLHRSFAGRRVLVTGGASGIDRAVVDDDGATAFVLDRNAEQNSASILFQVLVKLKGEGVTEGRTVLENLNPFFSGLDRELDYASPQIYLESQLKEVDIVQGRCRLFRMNKTITGTSSTTLGGELVVSGNFLEDLFRNWNQTVPNPRGYAPPLIKLSIHGQSLHNILDSVPQTIRHLNLQNIP